MRVCVCVFVRWVSCKLVYEVVGLFVRREFWEFFFVFRKEVGVFFFEFFV